MISKHLGESQKVVAKDRCLLNTGKFTLIFLLLYLKKQPLKTGDCLIQVVFKTGLTVYQANHSSKVGKTREPREKPSISRTWLSHI